MNARIFLSIIILVMFLSGITFADRTLERGELLQIFEQLTAHPCKTWIPAGTIEATHLEYKAATVTDVNEINRQIAKEIQQYQNEQNKRELTEEWQKMKLDAMPFNVRHKSSNEYTMNSTVLLKFDGNRFYWEINVDSRADSVKPGKDLADNFMTQQFDLDANKRRIFAWDGEKYTAYFLPGNDAIVDARAEKPHTVNGPLTAGLVPWGYGYYTYENLTSVESSAVEKDVEGETQVHLTLNMSGGVVKTFALSPSKNYALVSYLATGNGKSVDFRKYSDYRLIADKWLPMTIVMEQYDSETNRLLARDLWNITRIDISVPGVENFDVNYELDAQVEFFSPATEKPVMYRYSGAVDTDALLTERLTYASSQGTHTQNCATAALKYSLSKLDKNMSQNELAPLVSGTTGFTSLAAMKQFVQNLGLYCRAVKTDIQTMRNLRGCQAILHIPGKNHFVALEAIDDKYVWTIDLAANKFYDHTDISFFDMDWTEGTALLISKQPIQGEFNEINGNELVNIIGGKGYSCTILLQEYNVIFCSYIGGLCGGCYVEYEERWGCGAAASGNCSTTKKIRYVETPCILDPVIPEACTVTGEDTIYYMRACN
jgi:hypothetical protein